MITVGVSQPTKYPSVSCGYGLLYVHPKNWSCEPCQKKASPQPVIDG